MRRRLAASLFTLACPGPGQLYNGQPLKAIVLLVASWAVSASLLFGVASVTFAGFVTALSALFVIFGVALLDAVRLAPSGATRTAWFSGWRAVPGFALALLTLSGFVLPDHSRMRGLYIPSGSMEPTLQIGDRLIAEISPVEEGELHRGQLVIFRSPEGLDSMLIERVVGLPGEVVEMRRKVLLVDGVEIPEWAHHRDLSVGSLPERAIYRRDNFGPLEVPSSHVFVLGDNRDFSYDSRFYGPVPIADVIGRPLYLYWSRDRSRIGLRF